MTDILKDIAALEKCVNKDGDIIDSEKMDELQENIQQALGLTDENCDTLVEGLRNLVERVKELENDLADHKHFADGSAGFKK